MRGFAVIFLVGITTAVPFNPFNAWKASHRSSSYSSYGQEPSQDSYSKYFMKDPRPMAYGYMSHPMAAVEMARPQVKPYSGHHSFQKYHSGAGAGLWEKMVGEQFFKHPGSHSQFSKSDEDHDEVPYTVVKDYGPFECREYPEAKFACVKTEVDNAEDPMAGLENVSPLEIMSSKRWRKTPSSLMFRELFKYISGVNKEGKEVEMTRPVSTHHQIVKKQEAGDMEVQEMCFYIPAEHQAYPPQPLDSSPVYIHTRPTMRVFARSFGGYLMTSEQWREQREVMEALLIGKPYHQSEYYTNGYNSPMTFFNRRNEIWIEDTDFEKSVHNTDVVDVGVESAEEAEPEVTAEEEKKE